MSETSKAIEAIKAEMEGKPELVDIMKIDAVRQKQRNRIGINLEDEKYIFDMMEKFPRYFQAIMEKGRQV